jgi:Flp pilus assembly protein TadD
VHGNNLTLKGRYEDGLKIDRRLVRLRPCDPLAHYNLACSYALLKKVDSSLRALRKAMEFGYRDFRYLREDKDLAAVRKDPRFRRLLREFEKR